VTYNGWIELPQRRSSGNTLSDYRRLNCANIFAHPGSGQSTCRGKTAKTTIFSGESGATLQIEREDADRVPMALQIPFTGSSQLVS